MEKETGIIDHSCSHFYYFWFKSYVFCVNIFKVKCNLVEFNSVSLIVNIS